MTALTDTDRSTRLGILCAVAASMAFSVNDVAVKFLSGGYALHQVVMIRSAIAMAVLLAVMVPFNGGLRALRTRRPGALMLRGMLVVLSNLCYFLGLAALPLADAVAIFFVAPLLITALSVPLLGERVGPRRWAAVCLGLAGVVVMVRPGGGFVWAAVLPLVSAVLYALMHMMTRALRGTESAVTLTFYVQLMFLASCAAMGLAFGSGWLAEQSNPSLAFLFRGWAWPAAADWPVLAATGLASAFGSVLVAQAYRLCEAGLVAPFEYAALPLAVAAGLLVFGQWPDATTWVGIALICGAGLYVFLREAALARPRAGAGRP